MYYSQHGEDRWLEAHWDATGLPDRGVFVEAGAADGVLFTNTKWLEQTKNWSGILVEPDPRWWKLLKTNRSRAVIDVSALGPDETLSLGLTPSPLLSGQLRRGVPRIETPCLTLSQLLSKYNVPRLDYLSLDTDGTELRIWNTLARIIHQGVRRGWLDRESRVLGWGVDAWAQVPPPHQSSRSVLVRRRRDDGVQRAVGGIASTRAETAAKWSR